ncbi:MAG: hypothetical protein K2K66_02180 [Ruminococcus sp.]|nr:hypothetical protein [Ruminococcus sp.]
MPRAFYNEIFNGKEDENLLKIIENCNSDEKRQRIIKMLLEIIENELTPRQRDMVKEYFFNNKKTTQIAEEQGVSAQAVSARIRDGKRRIYNIIKYFI